MNKQTELYYIDTYTTTIGNISISKGFYKDKIELLKIASHLKELLNDNPTNAHFSRKQLKLPISWYQTLRIYTNNQRQSYDKEWLAKNYDTLMANDNTSFLHDGILVPHALYIQYSFDGKVQNITYLYNRQDIQSLCDFLYSLIQDKKQYLNRKIKRLSQQLQDLKTLSMA
jgi:hypothetical protein